MKFVFAILSVVLLLGCWEDQDKRMTSVVENNSQVKKKTDIYNSPTKGNIVKDTEKLKSSDETRKIREEKKAEATRIENNSRTTSTISDMSCDDIIIDYGKAIGLLANNMKSEEGLSIYKRIYNDPRFRDCKREASYKSKIKELDKKFKDLRSK